MSNEVSPEAMARIISGKNPIYQVLKPGEDDPDFIVDRETGHYLLAINDLIADLCEAGGSEAEKREMWQYSQTPLGGYRPLPSARKFHKSRARFRHCLGGNRSSKSHSVAVEVLWLATGLHPFRRDVAPKQKIIWYASTTLEKVADILWGKLDPLKNGLLLGLEMLGYKFDVVWRSKQLNIPNLLRIFWPNKSGTSEIIFKAYEQGRESFQGSEVDDVAFDEQFPQDVFVEATSRIGPGKPCSFLSAFTPLIPDQWLENRTHWEKPETDEVFQFPLDDQRLDWGGFIEAKSIMDTIDNWPDEVRETRRFGRWGAYVGAIFQSFNREIHVVSEAKEREFFWLGRHTPGSEIQPVGIIDWGGANPFAFIWAARIPHLDNDWYVFDELFWDPRVRGMRRLEALAQEIQRTTRVRWGTVLWRCWADHDPTNAFEFRNYGISTHPVQKVGSVEEISRAGIEALQTHLMPRQYLASKEWPRGRPRLHIAERCKELIREMPLYRWSEPTGEKNARNVPVKKDDHLVDCCRYLLSSERTMAIGGHASKRIDAGVYRTFNAARAAAFAY